MNKQLNSNIDQVVKDLLESMIEEVVKQDKINNPDLENLIHEKVKSKQKRELENKTLPDLYQIPNENQETLPKYGTPELIQYLSGLMIDNNFIHIKGVENLPNQDIKYILEKTGIEITHKNNETIRHLATCLVFNRLSNRVCDYCGSKDIKNLKLCQDCCISWYCGDVCQAEHWDKHKLRCCNLDGPLDDGYQKIKLSNKSN